MTGEISIRGRVMALGGLKEKTMAALRHGVRTVIIPADNERDLRNIDPVVRDQLTFVTAHSVDTVLETALCKPREQVAPMLGPIPEESKSKSRKPALRQ